MAYGICRIQKIHGWEKLSASGAHTERQRETPNANPQISNINLIGDGKDLATVVKTKIGEQTIRKNAVLAVEMLLSASPEYFRPDDPTAAGVYDQARVDQWAKHSIDWLRQEYGDRVVSATLHLDESTPHIHAHLVPLDEKGKLNCRALFGGSRHRLSKLQDSYAAAVQSLGLERGIKGSRASHKKISQYYTDVNRESKDLDLERQLPQPEQFENTTQYRERVITTLQPEVDVINHQLVDRQLARKQKEDTEQKALASERERQRLEQKLAQIETLASHLLPEGMSLEQGVRALYILPLAKALLDMKNIRKVEDSPTTCTYSGKDYKLIYYKDSQATSVEALDGRGEIIRCSTRLQVAQGITEQDISRWQKAAQWLERQRVEAERQRVEAEHQRVEAEHQRVEAERQRVEAERQRGEGGNKSRAKGEPIKHQPRKGIELGD